MPDDWHWLRGRVESASSAIERLRADLAGLGAGSLSEKPQPATQPSADFAPLQVLLNALDTFPTLVGYLQGRRKTREFLVLADEADVQDLLFVALKPIVPELVYEEPTKKGAAGYSVGDFSISSLKLILEVKYIKERSDVKAKADEIAEDIWKYMSQTDCQRIVFFVYDPNLLIPNRTSFVKGSSAQLESDGRQIEVQTIIKP